MALKRSPSPKKKSKPNAPKTEKETSSAKKRPFWVGFDLGGTKMLACVFDEKYELLGSAKKSTQGSEGQSKGGKKVCALIEEAISAAGVSPNDLQGIGIGCPGLVNPEKGVLINAPNLGWNQMPLRNLLAKHFKKPVAVLNDVDAGTYGEYRLGAGKGARSLLGVFPGTGVGSGFVYDGKLVQGKTVSAMELGMIYLPGTHLNSPEPGTVLLEDLTSRLAVASQAGVACYRGQLPELDRKTQGNLRDIRSKALANTFRSGDEIGILLFRNSIRYLSLGIAAVVNLLAPDRIILGGGLVEELPDLYLQLIREEVGKFALPTLAKGVKYTVAKLGNTAVAKGSVAWLRDQAQ